MATSYLDQFFVMDPGNPPAGGTALAVTKLTIVDGNDNNWISATSGELVGGLRVTSVWVGDTIRVVMNGQTVTITGVTFYRSGGPAVFTPTDGTVLENATFVSSTWVNTSTQVPVGSFGPPCFVAGTLIRTPKGEQRVETLGPGDLVETRDQGAQPLAWVGQRVAAGLGDFAPVRFAPGSIGNTAPLLVSPQHRMLVRDWRAQLFFGEDEVLVAALHLVDGAGVTRAPSARVRYVHLMFDRHQIVTAMGAPSESFYPGATMLAGDAAIRAELLALFPGIAGGDRWAMARPLVRGREALLLAA
ncbi:MAG: Hint domain-containing protein [Phaeovulum sp.]|uniref:Hint domain-containing protein n=1 Tax=Phaeovulum sp. TaxID=2934796 RepID=UPI002730AC4E|nr:Hint domain-containing protein [Phaeovulum sp.]MDP2061825.1 Hint domain-containing protein [Phaeovulum sp.]